MGSITEWMKLRLKQVFLHPTILVPSVTSEISVGNNPKMVAAFNLGTGRWVVFAKATAQGYGGNEGLADVMLQVVGTEGGIEKRDETYETAAPNLAGSMTVILAMDVTSTAHVEVTAHAQSGRVDFKHIVVTAIREA